MLQDTRYKLEFTTAYAGEKYIQYVEPSHVKLDYVSRI